MHETKVKVEKQQEEEEGGREQCHLSYSTAFPQGHVPKLSLDCELANAAWTGWRKAGHRENRQSQIRSRLEPDPQGSTFLFLGDILA